MNGIGVGIWRRLLEICESDSILLSLALFTEKELFVHLNKPKFTSELQIGYLGESDQIKSCITHGKGTYKTGFYI